MVKIFGTDGIRCLVNQEPLSAETTLKISKTVGYLLRSTIASNLLFIILIIHFLRDGGTLVQVHSHQLSTAVLVLLPLFHQVTR